MHFAIVGNGILSLTTAFRLIGRLGPSDQVTIVGPAVRPGSASLAAGAMLNSFAEVDAGGLETDVEMYHFELSHLATRMWPKFILDVIKVAGSRLPHGCSKCEGPCGGCFDAGTYIVNNTASDDLDDANFDAVLWALKEFDEQHELVSPRDIPNYAPEQRFRATRAVYIPNEGWLNPRLTVEALESAIASCPQIRVIDGTVTRLVRRGDAIERAVLADGTSLEADRFLLANGAAAGDLARASELGLAMQRVFYGVGVSLEIRSIDHPHKKTIRTPNRGLACGLYTVPYFVAPDQPHDHILIGASNHILGSPRAHARLASIENLSRGAIEQIQAGWHSSELVRVNVGWRPTSQDTFPLVGPCSISNLVIATGTKRDGFHLAPVLSDYLATMLTGGSVDERFAMFAPERPMIRHLSRERAIDIAVRHQMSVAYQHGFNPSKSNMPQAIAAMYRADLERLHDQVGAHDWGIPAELIEPYRKGEALSDGTYPRERTIPIATA